MDGTEPDMVPIPSVVKHTGEMLAVGCYDDDAVANLRRSAAVWAATEPIRAGAQRTSRRRKRLEYMRIAIMADATGRLGRCLE